MLHQMRVAGLVLDPISNAPIVILKKDAEEIEGDEQPVLPIWIGEAEAAAIAVKLMGVTHPRPMTHDLLKSAMGILGGRVDRIEVFDLKDGTFFARLFVERKGEVFEIDSRPSDAIALALRCDADILVAQRVLDQALDLPSIEAEDDEESPDERWNKILQSLSADSTGKYEQ